VDHREKDMSGNTSDRRLNILVISSLLPYPPDNGGINRLFNLYSRLGSKHSLTWISPVWPGSEAYVQESEHLCDRLVVLPRDDEHRPFPDHGWRNLLLRAIAHLHWERLFIFCFGYVQAPGLYWLPASPKRLALINEVASSSHFDLVVSEFEGNAELLPSGIDAAKVIMLHNTLSTLFRRIRKMYHTTQEDRLFFWPELLKIIQYEKRHYARYNLAVTVSEEDRRVVRSRCPGLPVEIIPNGVDSSFFEPPIDPGRDDTIVYIGHYGYPPNADAILHFCRRILPLIRRQIPSVQVLAIGREPPAELAQYEGVQTMGFVPDVRPYLTQAGVVIAPLRVGGGTRIKVLEALAMGKAVVSTTLGAEGLSVAHGENILLADEPATFADSVVRLLEQPELRARLGRNGRKLVTQTYDWDHLAARLDVVFQRAVNDFRRTQSDAEATHLASFKAKNAQS
jgi:glycosyltransferase involved in cell wall biosynthesis